jgi:hypothetical protein
VAKPEGRAPYTFNRILKVILKKYGGTVWTGLRWLRIEPSGRLLRKMQ